MGCKKEKKEFFLIVDGREYRLLALDDCVFATVISFPVNDEDVAAMMWEQVTLNNNIDDSEKEKLLPALVEFYHAHKHDYALFESQCSGCNECN